MNSTKDHKIEKVLEINGEIKIEEGGPGGQWGLGLGLTLLGDAFHAIVVAVIAGGLLVAAAVAVTISKAISTVEIHLL